MLPGQRVGYTADRHRFDPIDKAAENDGLIIYRRQLHDLVADSRARVTGREGRRQRPRHDHSCIRQVRIKHHLGSVTGKSIDSRLGNPCAPLTRTEVADHNTSGHATSPAF